MSSHFRTFQCNWGRGLWWPRALGGRRGLCHCREAVHQLGSWAWVNIGNPWHLGPERLPLLRGWPVLLWFVRVFQMFHGLEMFRVITGSALDFSQEQHQATHLHSISFCSCNHQETCTTSILWKSTFSRPFPYPQEQPHTKDGKSAICTRTAHAQIGFTYFTVGPQPPLAPHFLPLRCIMATPSTHVGRRWKRPGARTALGVCGCWLWQRLTLGPVEMLAMCRVPSGVGPDPPGFRCRWEKGEVRRELPQGEEKLQAKILKPGSWRQEWRERNQQKDSWTFWTRPWRVRSSTTFTPHVPITDWPPGRGQGNWQKRLAVWSSPSSMPESKR